MNKTGAKIGHLTSEETKRKISIANKGKKRSNEVRLKMSLRFKGKKLSEEHKRKIGLSNKGKNIWSKGYKHTEKARKRISLSMKGRATRGYGWKTSLITRKKMSEAHLKIREKHWSWQGGKSYEPYSIDWTETLKRAIREKYNYICQLCNLYGNNAHHIDYNKQNCNTDNLINLCRNCNLKVNQNRNYWLSYFNNLTQAK